MDENMSHAISLMGATLLFMVAFSLSVIFYNGLQDRAEEFFTATTIGARQEDATTIITNRDELERKIYPEEVFLAILNLPAYVSGDGNANNSKIMIGKLNASGDFVTRATYTASFDLESNTKVIGLDWSSTSKVYVTEGVIDTSDPKYAGKLKIIDDALLVMLKDFLAILGSGNTTADTTNDVLNDNQTLIKNTTFSIQYAGDAIKYIKN